MGDGSALFAFNTDSRLVNRSLRLFLGLGDDLRAQQNLTLRITRADGSTEEVPVLCRVDTDIEIEYYRHGGILSYVLRQLVANG